jgi:hypothetical protein
MPTGVYDSSLITQRARAKAESNSFINRIQNPTNPKTSYGPLTGIYDNSEVNRVNNGQMKYFQRNGACTVAYIGCPCTATVNGQVVNNVVIVAPGQVTNVTAEIGSIIVTWTPVIATGPITYTITTTPATTPQSIDDTNVFTYTNPTTLFTPGTSYRFIVTASNAGGTGTPSDPSAALIAPYAAPTVSSALSDTVANSLVLTVNYSGANSFSFTSSTRFSIKSYINGVFQSTTTNIVPNSFTTTSAVINRTSLTSSAYSFKVQAIDGTKSTSYSNISNILYPTTTAPVATLGIYNSASAQITISAYTPVPGFNPNQAIIDTILNATIQDTIAKNYTAPAPNILTLSGLTAATGIYSFKVKLKDSVTGAETLLSNQTASFYSNGIAPSIINITDITSDNATINFQTYDGSSPEFVFTRAGITDGTIFLDDAVVLNDFSIDFSGTDKLTPATTYENFRLILSSEILYPGYTIQSNPASLTTFKTKGIAPSIPNPNQIPYSITAVKIYINDYNVTGGFDLSPGFPTCSASFSGIFQSSTILEITNTYVVLKITPTSGSGANTEYNCGTMTVTNTTYISMPTNQGDILIRTGGYPVSGLAIDPLTYTINGVDLTFSSYNGLNTDEFDFTGGTIENVSTGTDYGITRVDSTRITVGSLSPATTGTYRLTLTAPAVLPGETVPYSSVPAPVSPADPITITTLGIAPTGFQDSWALPNVLPYSSSSEFLIDFTPYNGNISGEFDFTGATIEGVINGTSGPIPGASVLVDSKIQVTGLGAGYVITSISIILQNSIFSSVKAFVPNLITFEPPTVFSINSTSYNNITISYNPYSSSGSPPNSFQFAPAYSGGGIIVYAIQTDSSGGGGTGVELSSSDYSFYDNSGNPTLQITNGSGTIIQNNFYRIKVQFQNGSQLSNINISDYFQAT